MKKLRMFALPVMLASCAFLFAERNSAKSESNLCLPPDAYCTSNISCCSRTCCQPNDPRQVCEFHTGTTDACL